LLSPAVFRRTDRVQLPCVTTQSTNWVPARVPIIPNQSLTVVTSARSAAIDVPFIGVSESRKADGSWLKRELWAYSVKQSLFKGVGQLSVIFTGRVQDTRNIFAQQHNTQINETTLRLTSWYSNATLVREYAKMPYSFFTCNYYHKSKKSGLLFGSPYICTENNHKIN